MLLLHGFLHGHFVLLDKNLPLILYLETRKKCYMGNCIWPFTGRHDEFIVEIIEPSEERELVSNLKSDLVRRAWPSIPVNQILMKR